MLPRLAEKHLQILNILPKSVSLRKLIPIIYNEKDNIIQFGDCSIL